MAFEERRALCLYNMSQQAALKQHTGQYSCCAASKHSLLSIHAGTSAGKVETAAEVAKEPERVTAGCKGAAVGRRGTHAVPQCRVEAACFR